MDNLIASQVYPQIWLMGDQVDDADADPTNELQVITTNSSPGNISLSGDKTLSINVNDADLQLGPMS